MSDLKQHPLSAAFPAMPDEDLSALAEDIAAHGQQEPGITLNGMVLDGWHRYRACHRAGIPFRANEFDGADPVAFVMSRNMHRRHLTASQRAAAVVALAEWAPVGVNQHITAGCAPGAHLTADEMAKAADVSVRTIVQAKAAHKAGLGDAVKTGDVSVKRAAEIAQLPKRERAAALKAKPPTIAPAVSDEVVTLHGQIAELRDQNAELSSQLKEATEDNESMARVLEADDKVQTALAEAKRYREQHRIQQERVNGLMNERNAAIREAKSWKRKAEAAQ